MNRLLVYCFFPIAVLASADWVNTSRYGSGYVKGFQMAAGSSTTRVTRCVPCDERSSVGSASNTLDEYRGNGADNLGYDWSPKAWGGPAFPNKAKMPDDWPVGARGGRQMPGSWETRDRCQGCSWSGSYSERPRDWEDRWERERGSSTKRPSDWPTTGAPNEATVTSQVLGIMYRNDKRLPVPWEGDGRSMRWDGFRNGIPWEQPDHMDKRSWNEDSRPWEDKGSAGWDGQGKGHYAASWKHGSPATSPSGGSSWNRPWTGSDSRRPDERGYGQSGNLPFGSSYPQQHSNNYPQSSNNYPSSSNYPQSSNSYPSSSNYPSTSNYPSSPSYSTDRPGYSTSSWRPTTGPYPPKNQYVYPTTSRPYPEIIYHRPSYQEVTPRPGYQSPTHRPQDGTSWNYQDQFDQNRPGQWTTPRPNQNYLPDNSRPSSRPGYVGDRPSAPVGVPSITIWNGHTNDHDTKPGSRPGNGYYTGFITEIQDGSYLSGSRPIDRPSSGYPSSFPTNDRHPSSDRYPGNSYNSGLNGYPSSDRDRYPSSGGSRYPTNDGNRYPAYEPNSRPSYGNHPGDDGYSTQQRPDDRNPWYNDRDKPSFGSDRYPSQGSKYPSSDRYPVYDRYPSNSGERDPYDKDRYPSHDRYPGYDKDRYPSSDGNRYPSSDGNRYPSSDRDRYPSSDGTRYPSSDGTRYPSSDGNRYPNSDRDRYPNDRDRYPSRPGSSDHDRGPLPNSDSGSWNYGEDGQNKDGTYKRSGGSYPSYKGGKYFTSSYLASASTPASSNDIEGKKPTADETTTASSLEQTFGTT